MRKILYRTKVLYIIYSKQKQVLSKTSVLFETVTLILINMNECVENSRLR